VAGGSGTRVGAEGADGRKIVANDGEVKAASSSSLSAFVLLGVPAWRRYMYRRIAEGTRGGRDRSEKSLVLLKASRGIDKNGTSGTTARRR